MLFTFLGQVCDTYLCIWFDIVERKTVLYILWNKLWIKCNASCRDRNSFFVYFFSLNLDGKWLLVTSIKLSRSDSQSWKRVALSIPRSYRVNRVSIGWNHWLCLNLIRLTLVKFIRPLITIHEAKNSNSKVQALSGLYPSSSFSVFYLPIISLYLYLPHNCL